MRTLPRWLLAAILLHPTALLSAQETVVVRAARMLDVAGGRVVSPASVTVQGDRIVSVGGKAPADARTLDLGDVTLLPGLIDLHTHLTGDLSTPDWVAEPVRGTPAGWALRGAMNARITLAAGFTTVRDVGAGGFSDVALMRALDAGFVPGRGSCPRGMQSESPAATATTPAGRRASPNWARRRASRTGRRA